MLCEFTSNLRFSPIPFYIFKTLLAESAKFQHVIANQHHHSHIITLTCSTCLNNLKSESNILKFFKRSNEITILSPTVTQWHISLHDCQWVWDNSAQILAIPSKNASFKYVESRIYSETQWVSIGISWKMLQ